ncbi:winged helix-turn-helix transcriptional regulator [Streptomyces chromofuscus]|uniref:Helix-turn-helix transcriptional regulator n=1 Tax=Streptomyces chromofuscus TaxID=42881 RepID=A0A7M2T6D6_STRCW|nr:helix-turn-helix domain-containing protein [Streptomyces chromofuscus]QOV43824.1 helix-turn-helix transcriptional regulator [Streptomyces chromofuscus]GGT21562.1 transcriptional regulator [Streptomyces chromofuscus]
MTDRMAGAGEEDDPCEGIEPLFELLGKRWTGLILAALMHKPAFFAELHRSVVGISARMLTERLAELSAHGLVVREVGAGRSCRVSYRLTDAGAALGPAFAMLRRWGVEHLTDTALVSDVSGESGPRP